MPKFVIDTRKSEYSPIIVEINGKEYPVRVIDWDVVRELDKYDEEVKAGIQQTSYERMAFLLDLDEEKARKVFKGIGPKKMNELTLWIVRAAYLPDAEEMKDKTPDQKKKKSNEELGSKQ
jgi:hypothetical protein